MEYKNVVGRKVARLRYRRGWSQADLARELQKEGWDISRSGVSKIELRMRQVQDWQMMFFVRVLESPYENFYPEVARRTRLSEALADLSFEKN